MAGFLDGKLSLVTGASRGIGAATAEALAGAGAHVVLTARTAEDLEAVEQRIHEAGGAATIAPLDLAEGDSIARLAQAVAGRWQALDVLVLNAATLGTLTPVAQIDGKEFNRLLTLNLLAQQALIAAFDPLLRNSEAGRLIAVTSSVGRHPRAYWGALWRFEGGAGDAGAGLWRGGRQHFADPGGDRRSGRDRDADARPRLSGRGSGDAESAVCGRSGDHGIAAKRVRDRVSARTRRYERSIAVADVVSARAAASRDRNTEGLDLGGGNADFAATLGAGRPEPKSRPELPAAPRKDEQPLTVSLPGRHVSNESDREGRRHGRAGDRADHADSRLDQSGGADRLRITTCAADDPRPHPVAENDRRPAPVGRTGRAASARREADKQREAHRLVRRYISRGSLVTCQVWPRETSAWRSAGLPAAASAFCSRIALSKVGRGSS